MEQQENKKNKIQNAIKHLCFDSIEEANYQIILNQYTDLLKELLILFIEYIKDKDSDFYHKINKNNLLNDAFIISPEISFMILFNNSSIKEVYPLFRKLIIAEDAKNTRTLPHEYKSLWSSDGGFFISLNERGNDFFIYEAPKLFDKTPIDFLSPFSSFIKNEEMGEDYRLKIKNYGIEEFDSIIETINDCTFPLKEDLKIIINFISTFTLSLIPKKHSKNYFTSGSNNLYIGRSVLTNLHIISREILIESLVHEAAHSYLYMLEAISPWMPDIEDSIRNGNVVTSCWTGNNISVRSFSQAIFIWFSLYNFWALCQEHELYNQEFINKRLSFIRNGFQKLNIEKVEDCFSTSFSNDTKKAINSVQNIVLN